MKVDYPIISADSHITEAPNTYTDFIDPAWRDRAPHLVDGGDKMGDMFVVEGSTVPIPTPDASRIRSARLIKASTATHVTTVDMRSVALGVSPRPGGVSVTVPGVPDGTYDVWVTTVEDDAPVVTDVLVEGTVVLDDLDSGPAGTWRRSGPFRVAVTGGALDVATTGDLMLSGVEARPVG